MEAVPEATTMSRSLKWWCAGIVALFLALIGVMGVNYLLKSLHSVRGNGVTKANYARIKYGMSCKDVEETLGCPPGDYSTGYRFKYYNDAVHPVDMGSSNATWVGNHGYIKVRFNDRER
jgi:hypothetical protein